MKKTISKISAFAIVAIFTLAFAISGTNDVNAQSLEGPGDEYICCDALQSECFHPDGHHFLGAQLVNQSNCNGYECPECDWGT